MKINENEIAESILQLIRARYSGMDGNELEDIESKFQESTNKKLIVKKLEDIFNEIDDLNNLIFQDEN